MNNLSKRQQAMIEEKQKVHRRVNTPVDPANYECIPAKKQVDYYDNDIPQRVAVYARVSTDNVQQTSSYELQKKYYEEFVIRHPNWTLVKIYADEGISGTSMAHRDEFLAMIADSRAGKIDMIITKSVSRFARNVVDFLSMVQSLAELPHPVGIFFESECIFSLKDDSQMALSFQATMAQEESHIRSRSMETSLHMRLDGGLPLTPKLLGYSHDTDGNLIVNHEEAPTVIMSDELDVDRAVEERFAIAVHAVDQRHHILQIALGSDGLLEVVGVGFAHAVLIGRIVDDLFFLVGRDLTGVDAERHTVLFSEVAEDCLLLSGGGILSERPDASEGVATDDVVGTELDDGRSDHVKEVL